MVQITSILLALVLSCPIGVIHAAPVNNAVDANTLLKNGQTAQELNAAFNNLTINDQCKNGEEACISGALAKCDDAGKWEAQQCPADSQCFALPNTKREGTKIQCTSEQEALSLIEASGAQGGLFGDNSTDAGNGIDSVPALSNSSDSSATKTITVLVAPSTTQTLDSQTQTLDNAGVSSLLASLENSGVSGTATSSGAEVTELNTAASTGATVTSSGDGAAATGDSATATASGDGAAATSSAVNGAQGALATGVQGAAAGAAPTTILLTTGSSSDPSATADASVASASAPPSAPPSSGGYKF